MSQPKRHPVLFLLAACLGAVLLALAAALLLGPTPAALAQDGDDEPEKAPNNRKPATAPSATASRAAS